jgi:elongation factor Ts
VGSRLAISKGIVMNISANDVKTLRDRTNAPMMDCKKALSEASGDMAKAIQWLREKNAKIQVSKGDREAAEGRIAIFIDPAKKVGAILEMRCESPPVVTAEHFVKLANQVARHVALQNPASVDELIKQPYVDDPAKTVNDVIGDVVGLLRENMKPKRFARLTGLLGEYCHHDGSVGVLLLVEGEKADPQLLRDICMHVTAKNPVAARREDVPAEVVAKELEIAKAQAATTGKPANIVEKIAEGKMKTWFAENVLVEQPFVKDESKTIGDLLKAAGLKMVRFVRYKVGELS